MLQVPSWGSPWRGSTLWPFTVTSAIRPPPRRAVPSTTIVAALVNVPSDGLVMVNSGSGVGDPTPLQVVTW